MKKIKISSSTPYSFYLGKNVLEAFLENKMDNKRTWAILCDETLQKLYGKTLQEKLPGKKTFLFSFPAGEKNKSREQKQRIEDLLLAACFQKQDGILALGGGVTLDLAGFIASTYLRGIPYISIPTSLLAMIDACIGGKTAINTPFGKNLLGSLYPPQKGCIDIAFLQTLPAKEMKEGFAEGIKHALIWDSLLWQEIQERGEKILAKEPKALFSFVEKNVRIKAHIVSEDETEKGLRQTLNFGHTIGHALEKMTEYRLSHGNALYWGILIEAFLAKEKGFLSKSSYQKIVELFQKLDLLVSFTWELKKFEAALLRDKKNQGKKIGIIVLQEIGLVAPPFLEYFSLEEILATLCFFQEENLACLP